MRKIKIDSDVARAIRDQIKQEKSKGSFAADFHIHGSGSIERIPRFGYQFIEAHMPEDEVIQIADYCGLNVMCGVGHNQISDALIFKDQFHHLEGHLPNLKYLIPGWEQNLDEMHTEFLALSNENPNYMSVEHIVEIHEAVQEELVQHKVYSPEFKKFCRDNKLLMIAAHPLGLIPRTHQSAVFADGKVDFDLMTFPDALEVMNGFQYQIYNDAAKYAYDALEEKFNSDLQIAAVGGSDAHITSQIARCRTIMPETDCTYNSLSEIFKSKQTTAHGVSSDRYADYLPWFRTILKQTKLHIDDELAYRAAQRENREYEIKYSLFHKTHGEAPDHNFYLAKILLPGIDLLVSHLGVGYYVYKHYKNVAAERGKGIFAAIDEQKRNGGISAPALEAAIDARTNENPAPA